MCCCSSLLNIELLFVLHIHTVETNSIFTFILDLNLTCPKGKLWLHSCVESEEKTKKREIVQFKNVFKVTVRGDTWSFPLPPQTVCLLCELSWVSLQFTQSLRHGNWDSDFFDNLGYINFKVVGFSLVSSVQSGAATCHHLTIWENAHVSLEQSHISGCVFT